MTKTNIFLSVALAIAVVAAGVFGVMANTPRTFTLYANNGFLYSDETGAMDYTQYIGYDTMDSEGYCLPISTSQRVGNIVIIITREPFLGYSAAFTEEIPEGAVEKFSLLSELSDASDSLSWLDFDYRCWYPVTKQSRVSSCQLSFGLQTYSPNPPEVIITLGDGLTILESEVSESCFFIENSSGDSLYRSTLLIELTSSGVDSQYVPTVFVYSNDHVRLLDDTFSWEVEELNPNYYKD